MDAEGSMTRWCPWGSRRFDVLPRGTRSACPGPLGRSRGRIRRGDWTALRRRRTGRPGVVHTDRRATSMTAQPRPCVSPGGICRGTRSLAGGTGATRFGPPGECGTDRPTDRPVGSHVPRRCLPDQAKGSGDHTMGRSKTVPVPRRPLRDEEPCENRLLGRRACRPGDGSQNTLRRQLFFEDTADPDRWMVDRPDRGSAETDETDEDGDDTMDAPQLPAMTQPARNQRRRRKPPRRVTFHPVLATEMTPLEVQVARDDPDPSRTRLVIRGRPGGSHNSPPRTVLLRRLSLPHTHVVYKDDKGDDRQPPPVLPITTSLGVSDLWRQLALPGVQAVAEILLCHQQSLLRIELTSSQSPQLLLFLTPAALETCHATHRTQAEALRAVVASLWDGISDKAPRNSPPLVTARHIYQHIDNAQLQTWWRSQEHGTVEPRVVPGLVPTLRPYQQAAVEWMLQREQTRTEGREWELSWVVLNDVDGGVTQWLPDVVDTGEGAPGARLLYHTCTGWLATSYDQAKTMTVGSEPVLVSGGILAESMGLGKTVEVLACILGNPKPHEACARPGPEDSTELGEPRTMTSSSGSVACVPENDDNLSDTPEHDRHVGCVGGWDEFGDADCSSDEESRSRPLKTSVRSTVRERKVVPVTPEKPLETRYSVREEWIDEEELGSCICGKIIGFRSMVNEPIVICTSCREPLHTKCAHPMHEAASKKAVFNYRQRFTNKTIPCCEVSKDLCPSCVAASQEAIPSAATLIITPPAILDQWIHEIHRHVSHDRSLKVVVYEGVKACQSTKSSRSSVENLHPSVLAAADIVLMTFDSLMTDLGHSDENRFVAGSSDAHLRRRKRYRVVASPLVSIQWWRIVLDEAQRVETPTAGSARMALKLNSCHRWAVTGTPLGRGKLDDLYGLLLFLRLHPFTSKAMFYKSFQTDSGSFSKRIIHLLNRILWRSTKALPEVSRQLGLLEQVEKKRILRFSSIEKHFYNQQLQEALSVVGDLASGTSKTKKRKAAQSEVTERLYRLRAACCHPQVGSGGISHPKKARKMVDGVSESVGRRVMTMDQILVTFIEEARLKCEEAQRLVVMHRNAVAAISRLKMEAKARGIAIRESDEQLLSMSRDLYLESIQLVKENSVPSLILGEAKLTGSIGLSSSLSGVKNGMGGVVWKCIGLVPKEVYVTVDFLETAKKITQLRIRTQANVPTEVREGASGDFLWHALYPKDCSLQVQVNSMGEEYIDVASMSLPLPSYGDVTEEDWAVNAGFITNKSKSWRLMIKSFHSSELAVHQSNLDLNSFGIFCGISIELYEANIDNDPIQRLHALSNAMVSCRSLLNLLPSDEASRTNAADNDLLSSLAQEASTIESLYLDRARVLHAESKRKMEKASSDRIEKEKVLVGLDVSRNRQYTDCWDDGWWRDFLTTLHLYGSEAQKHAFLNKLNEEIFIYIEGNSHTLESRGVSKFPQFFGINGFMTALEFRVHSIRTGIGGKSKSTKKTDCISTVQRQKSESGTVDGAALFEFRSSRFKVEPGQHSHCMLAVSSLSDHPTGAEVTENSNCSVCKADWYKTGPECRHCRLGNELEDLTPDKVTEHVFRALGEIVRSSFGASILKDHGDPSNVIERCKAFFEVLDAQKREKVAAYRMWRIHLDLLNDLDELDQVKSSMRLTYEGEDLTQLSDDEKNAVVQPIDIHGRYHDHAAKEAMALGDLRRAQEKLRYLQSLVSGQSEEIECPICLNAFIERAVLRCGHSMCKKCLADFQAHSKDVLISCPKKCFIRTSPGDILLASETSKDDGTSSQRQVKGSYGTKVTHLLSDILDIRDEGDKGVVFSQWEDMLDIVQSALAENGVGFVRADSRRAIGESVSQFRAPNVTVLLLNVKNGAEGLTLLEATHCFMVEPILNAGLDAQAISRIHRIGQCRRTFVHRYLIEGTIETKIDKMREEHYADTDAIEESLNEGRKSVISAGGIDGGFGSKEEVLRLLSLEDN